MKTPNISRRSSATNATAAAPFSTAALPRYLLHPPRMRSAGQQPLAAHAQNVAPLYILGRTGQQLTRSSITAVRGHPPPLASGASPGPYDDSMQQPRASSAASNGGRSAVEASTRLQELQQAIELELGKQHRLKKSHLTATLGEELAMCPGTNLKDRVRGLKEAVGLEDAAALLHSHPYLVVYTHPSDVAARLDVLAAAFGTGRKAVVALCTGVPTAASVLQYDARNARQRVDALCSALQLGRQQLLERCRTYPWMLQVGPSVVLSRTPALGDTLGLDAAQVAALCQRNPNCLLAPAETVTGVVEALQEQLGVPREEAVQLCIRSLNVLQKAPASIAAKAQALKQHGLQGADVAGCMRLFSVPESEIAARLEALPAALGITQDEALLLVQDSPKFLLMKTATLTEGWQELQRAANMRPEWREQIGNWTAGTVAGCIGPGEKMRKRVDAVLELEPQQLPALAALLMRPKPAFQQLLRLLRAGEFTAHNYPVQCPERIVRVKHPGLWAQL